MMLNTKWFIDVCRSISKSTKIHIFHELVFADLSESVQSEDVLHGQDAAEVFLYGRLAVSWLVVLSAGGQPGQHLPVLWTMDVLWQQGHTYLLTDLGNHLMCLMADPDSPCWGFIYIHYPAYHSERYLASLTKCWCTLKRKFISSRFVRKQRPQNVADHHQVFKVVVQSRDGREVNAMLP